MKMTSSVLIIAAGLVAVTSAASYPEGDERLGYVSVASDGATSITFNATSIQNAVILGLFILVLGALILPLFGISLASIFGEEGESTTGYAYGYDQPAYDSAYAAPAPGYSGFAKRSLELAGPVLEALMAAKRKYDQ